MIRIINIKNGEVPYIYANRFFYPQNIFKRGEKDAEIILPSSIDGKDNTAGLRRILHELIKKNDQPAVAALLLLDDSKPLGCYCCEMSGQEIFDREEICNAQVLWKAVRHLRQQRSLTPLI